MELRQLEYFVTVAETGNFTRAAARVHITQSGVSAQIRQLEREVGAPLLDRSGRTVTLTSAGAAALPHARTALAAAAAVRDAVDDVTGLVRGRLVIGMIAGCRITPFFDALARFHAAHPGIELTVIEDASDRLTTEVRAGGLDGALIGAAAGPPDGFAAVTIVSERLVALVPPGHPLARRRRPALADVVAHPLVTMPVGTGIRAVLDDACARGPRDAPHQPRGQCTRRRARPRATRTRGRRPRRVDGDRRARSPQRGDPRCHDAGHAGLRLAHRGQSGDACPRR